MQQLTPVSRLAATAQRGDWPRTALCFRNLETDIGELQSSLFLQFCLEEIGPFVYNRAISDAQAYMQERALDLENNCYALESTYWIKIDKKKAQRRSFRNKSETETT